LLNSGAPLGLRTSQCLCSQLQHRCSLVAPCVHYGVWLCGAVCVASRHSSCTLDSVHTDEFAGVNRLPYLRLHFARLVGSRCGWSGFVGGANVFRGILGWSTHLICPESARVDTRSIACMFTTAIWFGGTCFVYLRFLCTVCFHLQTASATKLGRSVPYSTSIKGPSPGC